MELIKTLREFLGEVSDYYYKSSKGKKILLKLYFLYVIIFNYFNHMYSMSEFYKENVEVYLGPILVANRFEIMQGTFTTMFPIVVYWLIIEINKYGIRKLPLFFKIGFISIFFLTIGLNLAFYLPYPKSLYSFLFVIFLLVSADVFAFIYEYRQKRKKK